MVIGIDASRANLKQKTGVEWYAYHVIRELAKLDQENRYRLYAWEAPRVGLDKLPENFEWIEVPDKHFWPYTALSSELKRNPVDRLFIPSHLVPRVHPDRTVVTIHDLGFRHFRENYSWYHYLSLHLGTRLSARWAETIVTPTQAVAKDVARQYDVPVAKLSVVPNGYDKTMFRETTPETVSEVMQEYRVRDPYLLFVGRMETRKNVARIIEAFYRLTDSGLFGGQLVLVGNPGRGYEEIRRLIGKQRKPDQVIHTGYLDDSERAALLVGARAFVFPSLFEGFGIPILEAFAARTPVLTSKGGATEEVAGEAALLADPHNVEAINQGMQKLLTDQSFAKELVANGAKRLRGYGWDKTAANIHGLLTR